MKTILTIILLIFTTVSFSQETQVEVLKELKKLTSDSGHYIKNKNDSTKIIVYQLCDNWSEKAKQLENLTSKSELKSLIKDENAAINILGYIFKLNVENKKEVAEQILYQMMDDEMKFIKSSCGDAYSSYSYFRYLLKLMTTQNPYFEADFKFKKRELKKIKDKMIAVETMHFIMNQ